ncbi:MAG: hypothetical protein CMJ49_04870 [Planctomycetaceae bacterium]|nr:hypothetical protein [Planctomycetaceae bacterium]
MRSLPFTLRPTNSRFVGLHLPLTTTLPKRLDPELQQYVGLHRFDMIVMAGIDPVVLDADDLLNLYAYVQRGGGLLMFGGTSAFDLAQRDWGPLCAALPASITPPQISRQHSPSGNHDLDSVNVMANADEAHPVLRGLSGQLGAVRHIHPMDPNDGATVLGAVRGQPVIVCGTHGAGRVMMVGAWPQSIPECMFATRGYADLLRQAMMWLIQRDCDLMIDACGIDDASMIAGESRTLTIDLDHDAPGPHRAEARIRRADPGWMSVGREPQFGDPLSIPADISEHVASCTFTPDHPGLWQIRMDVAGDGWANLRVAQIEVRTPTNLRLTKRDHGYVTAPGRTLKLHLDADADVQANLKIIDFDDQVIDEHTSVGRGPIDIGLPELEVGHYEAVAAIDNDEARLRFYVTQPLRHIPFTICGTTGSGSTEEQSQWLYEYFRDRGFNAHSRPNAYGEYLAQRDGLDVWTEYAGVSHLSIGHSAHKDRHVEESCPTRPCVFSPDYPDALRQRVEPMFERGASVPRMGALEVLDEPHFYPANVCHCECCQTRFRDKYGYAMPTWTEALDARDRRTADYFEWVNDYGTEAFRQAFELWKSFGPRPWVNHVLCGAGSGRHSARFSTAQDLHWAEHAHFFEFDCYNYMYPHWRPVGQLRWNEFHNMCGHFRFLSLRNQQMMGFFIQVTDRDAPVAPWDPLRAPSETLYAAIGQGAKTFHLMAKSPFTTGQNCREEKFDTLAQDVHKVQRVAPLLEKAQSPRSRIAMTFPFHDRHYRVPAHHLPEGYAGLGFYEGKHRPFDTLWPGHIAPINISELLTRGFGEVDVIDQTAFREGALEDYPAFMLNSTDYIADEDAQAALRYVEQGGTLICDHVPTHSTTGEQIATLHPMFGGPAENLCQSVTITRSQYGKGRTLLFSDDLNEMCTVSFEQNEPLVHDLLETTIRDYLHEGDIFPHAFCDHPELAANVLLTSDTIVLVAVSHAETRQQGHVTLFNPPVPVTRAFDLVTMQPYDIQQTSRGIELELDLDEREGLILGLYVDTPTTSTIKLDQADLSRGGRLAFSVELTNAQSQPARGDQIIDLRVTDPAGEQRRLFGGLRCASNGVLRIDEPLAANARTGEWTITAFDRYTTRQSVARFAVKP